METHTFRLSLDVASLKNAVFKGLIYFKHNGVGPANLPCYQSEHFLEVKNGNECKSFIQINSPTDLSALPLNPQMPHSLP
jgi:hypothetical protein